MKKLSGIENNSQTLVKLFRIHTEIGFDGNLERLVEATNSISPSGKAFTITPENKITILEATERAKSFIKSNEFKILKNELDEKVAKFKNYIILAALIENVNVRGCVIEYLITGEDEKLINEIVKELENGSNGIPPFKTENALADYERTFDEYFIATDIKTKIMILHSNPKAFNIDKILEFLSIEKSVFMFYFIGWF